MVYAPERWIVVGARDPDGLQESYGVYIVDEDNHDRIAYLTGRDEVERADYIIDCVQFCAGFTYEELQALGSLKALLDK